MYFLTQVRNGFAYEFLRYGCSSVDVQDGKIGCVEGAAEATAQSMEGHFSGTAPKLPFDFHPTRLQDCQGSRQ